MYCTALLAPMFWVVLIDPLGSPTFPSKVSHMVLIVVIDLIAALFFGLIVAGSRLNEHFISSLSLTMFIVSIVLLYLGTVYHESQVANAATEFKKQETDFSRALREHRR